MSFKSLTLGLLVAILLVEPAGAQGPIAWFSFDVPAEPGLDLVGGHDAITVIGVNQAPGVVGLAGLFNSGYMQLPATSDLELLAGDFTLSLFLQTSDLTNRNFFTKANPVHHRYGLGVYPTGQVGFLFFGNGLFGFALTSSIVVDGSWHHVAAVKRGLIAEVWVDGVLEDTDTINPSFTDDGAFAIGRDGECCESFNGMMDEVKIWSRALSSVEIGREAMPCSYGPTSQPLTFIRSSGKPNRESETWESCGGAGTLIVTSNSPSAASIVLNGNTIPPLYSGTVEVPISLLVGVNTVEVEVRSKPDSVVTLIFVPDE